MSDNLSEQVNDILALKPDWWDAKDRAEVWVCIKQLRDLLLGSPIPSDLGVDVYRNSGIEATWSLARDGRRYSYSLSIEPMEVACEASPSNLRRKAKV